MDVTIQLRGGQLAKFRAMSGLAKDTDLAEQMGVARQTVSRTLGGQHELSARFIAGLLTAFPHLTFDDLFEVKRLDTEQDAA